MEINLESSHSDPAPKKKPVSKVHCWKNNCLVHQNFLNGYFETWTEAKILLSGGLSPNFRIFGSL